MILTNLTLVNFRNYAHLEMGFPRGVVVLAGSNAQGKSNLLEAIYYLATSRSYRGAGDREIVNWEADSPAVMRLQASVRRKQGNVRIEIAVHTATAMDYAAQPLPGEEAGAFLADHISRKRVRINEVVHRVRDLVGQMTAVIFAPEDVELVSGAPVLRRRYLDILNSQLDPAYLRALQRYHRILVQRNHLLRHMRGRPDRAGELVFWNNGLVETGSYILLQRERAIGQLQGIAHQLHLQLTGGHEELSLSYLPSIGRAEAEPQSQEAAFREAVAKMQSREIAQGVSLVGPHRDDLRFLVAGKDVGVFGSRSQQRTVALSLKLAETEFMRRVRDDSPVLLLDDAFSELDAARRHHLTEFICRYQQVFITVTDLDRLEKDLLERAILYRVEQGVVEPLKTE